MGRVKEYYIREINSHDERIDEEYFYHHRKPKVSTINNLIKSLKKMKREYFDRKQKNIS
mgnify:CR=1 FL=1|jgi:hypothetical protein